MKKQYSVILITCLLFTSTNVMVSGDDSNYYRIQQSKVITVGISMDYPPLHLHKETHQKTKAYNGRHKGIEIDMAESLGKFLGVKVKFKLLKITEYTRSIEQNKVDIVMAGMSRNLQRAKDIWFSNPYLTLTPAVIIQTDKLPQTQYGEYFEEDPFSTIWDLKRLSIVNLSVKQGSTHQSMLKKDFSNAKVTIVKNNAEGLKTLFEGKVSGFVHDSLYLQYLFNQNPSWKNRYTILKGGTRQEFICVGLPFGDTVLLQQVNTWISEMKRTGDLEKIIFKHMDRRL